MIFFLEDFEFMESVTFPDKSLKLRFSAHFARKIEIVTSKIIEL